MSRVKSLYSKKKSQRSNNKEISFQSLKQMTNYLRCMHAYYGVQNVRKSCETIKRIRKRRMRRMKKETKKSLTLIAYTVAL